MKRLLQIIFKKLISLLEWLADNFGYQLTFSWEKKVPAESGLNLNVGAGHNLFSGFESLDLYTPHYYKNKEQFLKTRVEYDLREDNLPYDNDVVDNIYISHVIEHIETQFVKKFIQEFFRVLKPGGVLRIACPDGEFLYKVSQFRNGYWSWRHPTYMNQEIHSTDWDTIDQYDFLLGEFSAARCRFYNNKIRNKLLNLADIKALDYDSFKKLVIEDLVFRKEHPGDHINVWDFSELKSIGDKAGFSEVIKSKPRGSVSPVMQSLSFDKVFPQMSLYVDLVK